MIWRSDCTVLHEYSVTACNLKPTQHRGINAFILLICLILSYLSNCCDAVLFALQVVTAASSDPEDAKNDRFSSSGATYLGWKYTVNPLNPELNPIYYLLALLAHHFLHVSRMRVKSLTLRLLMSYIYGAPILDVSRSHTTTQHSR